MKRTTVALFILLTSAMHGYAADSMSLALNLGTVLGSEKFCGLTFDQKAITAYIEKNIRADDMSFPAMLTTMTGGTEIQNKSMSDSAKTAHCTQVTRIAKSYGFIPK